MDMIPLNKYNKYLKKTINCLDIITSFIYIHICLLLELLIFNFVVYIPILFFYAKIDIYTNCQNEYKC